MYLKHFNLQQQPFGLTPNTEFFCNLPNYQAALNVLLFSLRQGEGFVKIIAEIGMGKTLLCRVLLENLKNDFVTAYIPNPDLTPEGLRSVLAQELDIPKPYPANQHELLELIMHKLMELHAQNKRVVLLLDEAQALPLESLEAVRLLTNLETSKAKLLQVVLFGQPELDKRLNCSELRQLKQRITFAYHLSPLTRNEFEAYIGHRLMLAGATFTTLFDKKALNLLYQKCAGTPRLINILCHKALLAAYGRGERQVTHKAMHLAVKDTESVTQSSQKILDYVLLVSIIVLVIVTLLVAFARF